MKGAYMKTNYYTTVYERRKFKTSDGVQAFLNKIKNTEVERFEKVRPKKTYRSNTKPNIANKDEIIQDLHTLFIRLNVELGYYKDEVKEAKTYTFHIPKKTGGTRVITAPNDELKELHQKILRLMQDRLKLLEHDAAFAYIKERSTKDALIRHQLNESKYFLKVDIENFFGNCDIDLIKNKLKILYPFNIYEKADDLTEQIALFATLHDELPQGMPLSPYLTNLIMVGFDFSMSEYCKEKGLIYTRYADDIMLSSKAEFSFEALTAFITKTLVEQNYPFKLKKEKTRYGTNAGRNWNLGLMLNKDNQITIGHLKKKELKTILYKINRKELPQGDPTVIGLFAYLKQIEPVYYKFLNDYCSRHYNKTIDEIIK